MKVVTSDQMRTIEAQAVEAGVSVPVLMENAGLGIARKTQEWVGGIEGKSVLVLGGPGNNGGDGLVAARHFHDWGASVHVYLLGPRPEDDANLEQVLQREIRCTQQKDDPGLSILRDALSRADVVLDALLGTGKARPVEGALAELLGELRQARQARAGMRLVAVDLPTGLNADTGCVDAACVAADFTITLGFPKIGLFTFPGAARAGELAVAEIGIPPLLGHEVDIELITPEWVRFVLPTRPPDAHKGTFGRVLVVAGSRNFVGAAYMATAAVIRSGAGLATLATPEIVYHIVAGRLAEATFLPLPEAAPGVISADAVALVRDELSRYDVLLIGCGLGQRAATIWFVQRLLQSPIKTPTVVDADGLNALTKVPDWWKMLPHETVLTPHEGEMARLAGLDVSEVTSRRLELAREKAQEWDKVVLLKGAYSVIASPGGKAVISPWANPGLASGGTGDVLAGIVAGMLAQGVAPFEAAASAAYLHGLAGDAVRQDLGDTGMLASDLLPVLPKAIKKIKSE